MKKDVTNKHCNFKIAESLYKQVTFFITPIFNRKQILKIVKDALFKCL